jgi:hypothetical protein
MSDRYSTNQFYNFSNYEDERFKGDNPTAVGTDDNPAFIWPSANTRNAANKSNFPTQRGYMRMISEGYNDAAAKQLSQRRFHFQFNPDVLMRSVESTQGTQYWMNQDPAQFISPIPGNANFAFDFILNREAEVASRSYRSGYDGSVVPASSKSSSLPGEVFVQSAVNTNSRGFSPPSAVVKPSASTGYSQEAVVDIGVLADLFVFDQIIGQGMNQGVINLFKNKTSELIQAFNDNINKTGDKAQTTDEQDKPPVTSSITKEDVARLNNFLTGNMSNSAFLISQPVRVVFSSLFMVEGFITNSQVVFNKFNQSMVPTQCTVSVQMTAMYIGFATRNTFLTNTLRGAIVDTGTTVVGGTDEQKEQQSVTELSNGLYKDIKSDNLNFGLNPNKKLKVSDLFEKGDNNITKLTVQALTSKALRTYIQDGLIADVQASIALKVTYKGVNGQKTPNTFFDVGDVVYETQSSTKSLGKISDQTAVVSAEFEFAKRTFNADQIWDKNENAKYQMDAKITFTLITNLQDIGAKQVATVVKDFNYGEGIEGDDFDLNPKVKE